MSLTSLSLPAPVMGPVRVREESEWSVALSQPGQRRLQILLLVEAN